MKDLGEAKILGMEITRNRFRQSLDIPGELLFKVLERFNKAEAKLVTTPLAGPFKLSFKQYPQSPEEEEEMS